MINNVLISFGIIILVLLLFIIKKQIKMSAQLDQLTQDVTDITNVAEGAIALLGNLKTQLDAAIAANSNGDDTQLAALSETLEAEKQKLADAITANTPGA